MRRIWHDGSANQVPLERALALISQGGGQGKLIIVRGEAGAGSSAFASRLQALATRNGIRSIHIERSAVNSDFVLLAHIFRSLQLPIFSSELGANQRISRHYKAALHLRQYQAVICEDAHDYFNMYSSKLQGIYDSVHQLTRPPFGYNIVLCGLHDKLTEIGLRARVLGMIVEMIDLRPMNYDEAYFNLVEALFKDHRVSMPLLQSTHLPTPIPIRHDILTAPLGTSPSELRGNVCAETESAPDLNLAAATVRNLSPIFITSYGLDVRALHTYTSGLVGKTAEHVRRAAHSLEIADIGEQRSAAIPASATIKSTLLPIPEVTQDGGGNDHSIQPAANASATSQADPQILLPLFDLLASRITFQLELQLDEPQAGSPNDPGGLVTPHLCNLSDPGAKGFSGAKGGVFSRQAAAVVPARSGQAVTSHNNRHSTRHNEQAGSFRLYLKPVIDETLGSWLCRNAAAKSIDSIHGGFLEWCRRLIERDELAQASGPNTHGGDNKAGVQMAMPLQAQQNQHVADPARPIKLPLESQENDIAEEPTWNPAILLGGTRSKMSPDLGAPIEYDTLFRSQEFLDAFPATLRPHLASRFSLPPNAVQNTHNRRYCAQCIADDVAALRAPALRKAWRKRGAAVCTQHRQPVLLQQLERGTLSQLSGAWQAYMQHTQREDYDHGVGLISRNSCGYQGISAESRICRIVRRLQDWVEYAPALPTTSRPSKYALYFLLGFFLYQANLVSEGGVARWFIKSPQGEKLNLRSFEKPTITQMIKNIESASPRAMSMGYLLAGSAFELLTAAEITFLRGALDFTDYLFPATPGELKSLSQCFQSYHMIAVWESAYRNLSPEDCRHLEWLLRKY